MAERLRAVGRDVELDCYRRRIHDYLLIIREKCERSQELRRCRRVLQRAGAFGYHARFVCNSLMTLAALWTLATAASISSDDLSRRLRHRRAKSLVEMSMRFCGGLGLEDVSMFAPPMRFSDKPPT
jgi:hypothetical protein